MKTIQPTFRLPLIPTLLFLVLLVASAPAVDSGAVKKLFKNPPREYASAPLWVWNDLLTEDQIRDTMRDLAGQQVKQVFVHPRPGLMTPYLDKDWFRLWKVALREAERLDMNVWIYDENSYPSGFAGGWVPELMPESRGMGLALRESKTAPKWRPELVAVLRLEGAQSENVTARVKAGEVLPEGRYVVGSIVRAGNSPWHGNRSYVNLLTPGVTEKFLEVTLEAYKREIGSQFGKRVPGVFTDEPNIRPAGGFPWCPDLPEQFQKRWGYSLLDRLPGLTQEIGDWRQVRHNYFSTINDLFIERWAKPFYDWCETNRLEFTGHYWDHDWPDCHGVPNNMAMAAWQHRPGIDTLMNQYAEHTHAQFGNVRYCREISSLANQLGRKRTLVELYGAGGWDLRFEDMKRIGDWLQVLGINTMDEHLSYITLRGARKRDHPQSFSYHEPWWEAYHVNAGYLARLSCALSQGEQINRVLVIEPTTTAWMYQGNGAKLKQLGDAFSRLLMALEAAQIEYDLGDEDVIARRGAIDGKELKIGQRSYPVVVLPPFSENVNAAVSQLGEELLQAGGTVVCLGEPPSRVSGQESSRVAQAVAEPGWLASPVSEAPQVLRKWSHPAAFDLQRAPGDPGILFHHRRQLDDGQILLLVNTSIESSSAGTLVSDRKGVEQWNLYTGETEPYLFETTDQGVKAGFNLPPSGSLLLFLSNRPIKPTPPGIEMKSTLVASGPLEIRRLQPNVLTLDYVDVTAGGETRSNVYFYQANQFAWQKNGMDRNPWDSAVQFKDELISKKFPADSGFSASYRFTIEGAVPRNLALVIERPDLYTITCNGQELKWGARASRPRSDASPRRTSGSAAESKARTPSTAPETGALPQGDWWLDKAFGRIDLSSVARSGENRVNLKAQPFTMYHELESAYVLGDFTLKPAARGFVIAPDQLLRLAATEPRTSHSINPDGTMWLSAGVGQGTDDRAPFLVFDLGQPVDLTGLKVWNYNEAHVRDLTARGADKVRITAGAQPAKLDQDLGTFRLSRGKIENSAPDDLRVQGRAVRYVRFDILSSHHGVQYPASGVPVDNGYVGLAEVQFFAGQAERVTGVTVQRCSSELASQGRTARRVVDGSGLGGDRLGWNRQGHPFYSAGVAYRQEFNVAAPDGRYYLSLPSWLGSVARVLVNGKPAGYIAAPPWECEVTKQLKRGANTLEVVVIGTLKNTLGPHHGNPGLGSAWPGMFHTGPKDGPPAGDRYSTVGYGLFEPFTVRQLVKR